MAKVRSLKSLKLELDRVFSLFVRLTYSENGYGQCVTCKRRLPIKSLQAGHYVKRNKLNTRWDARNVFPQCVGCNVFQMGNYAKFTQYLLENYGQEWLEQLIKDGEKIIKLTPAELQDKITFYKERLKAL